MVGDIRFGQPRELAVCPVKPAAVHNDTAALYRMTIHILCRRVGYNISAKVKGAAENRCGKGVIHNQRHTVLMRNGENQPRIGFEFPADLFGRLILVYINALNAQLAQRMREQIDGSAVYLRR